MNRLDSQYQDLLRTILSTAFLTNAEIENNSNIK